VPDLGLIAVFVGLTVVHYFVSGLIRVNRDTDELLAVVAIVPRDGAM
jgi:hypothetical protein